MARFRTYIEESGTKKQKIDSVEDFVYDKFERARELLRPVHDIDLKQWAEQQARSTFFHEFVASDTWILSFKHKYNICCRKVTKVSVDNCRESFLSSPIYAFMQFVLKREVMNEEEIKKSADYFVSDVRALLPKYNKDFVLNTDQSGLEFEIHSTRTLSHQGEKTTVSAVRSTNEITHSYTVQPMISLSGKIIGPIYLCLKEAKGRMSDNIKAHLYKADNVLVTCSASGKLTTSLVEY